MTTITKGFKFRIYPNAEQRDLLARSFGCKRFVWNQCLDLAKRAYGNYLVNPNLQKPNTGLTDFNRYLNQLKVNHVWLYDVPSVALQQTTRDLTKAFTTFFRELNKGKISYPKFKKKINHQSIRLVGTSFRLDDGRLYVAKSKVPVKIKWTRDLPSKPTSCTISVGSDGTYYVSFVCESDPVLTNGVSQVGIDLGLTHFGITSDGKKIDNPRYFVNTQKRLKKAQQRLERAQKGSKNRNKARLAVAKVHSKITNQRNDFLHKLSRQLVNENQVIGLESLKVKNMVRNRYLAKAIIDVGWSKFVGYVRYKASESHNTVVYLMAPFYASSHYCSSCGTKRGEKLKLSQRSWVCSNCNETLDRDINAAKNILKKTLITRTNLQLDRHWTDKTVICSI